MLQNFQRQARRKFERHIPLDDETPRGGDDPVDSRLDIEIALRRLKPADRELITLVHWDGLSIVEAGHSLGQTAAVAYRRHRNALNELRMVLESADETTPVLAVLMKSPATES
ncbi:hypothetical protein BOH66_16030 [Microbacterium aurum]|uniref:RNA polymerase sigma-70 region 4 domain-containing protein n=1 Tax=Microbacterium aurum TaxID=36805 RepID=A0A1P8UBR2_9MICO|nr:sigma factor-like helix-turn-helix DNA-binding protein [Microbacterium aurum]APZ35573.1 hypothetical protein BOH66_16030 [Microbacterium aurum]MBM7826284.1 DNA-directed RNA polymerase specialized sigma24 family protein [Microbacterium aurum]